MKGKHRNFENLHKKCMFRRHFCFLSFCSLLFYIVRYFLVDVGIKIVNCFSYISFGVQLVHCLYSSSVVVCN